LYRHGSDGFPAADLAYTPFLRRGSPPRRRPGTPLHPHWTHNVQRAAMPPYAIATSRGRRLSGRRPGVDDDLPAASPAYKNVFCHTSDGLPAAGPAFVFFATWLTAFRPPPPV